MFTVEDYNDVSVTIDLALKQLKPDGQNCVICGDTGHQAWECQFNPLVALQWRNVFVCYHCGERFSDGTAKEHFGRPEQSPKCIPGLLTMYRDALEKIATRNYPTGTTVESIAKQVLP